MINPLGGEGAGEEGAGLCASRAFVYFSHVNCCSFSLSLGVKDWLRLVIVEKDK